MRPSNSEHPSHVAASDEAETAIGELRFEAALAELEQIVHNMEGGHLQLEDSLAAYRRGSELLKHCQQQLSNAERQIQILEDGALRDLAPDAGEAR